MSVMNTIFQSGRWDNFRWPGLVLDNLPTKNTYRTGWAKAKEACLAGHKNKYACIDWKNYKCFGNSSAEVERLSLWRFNILLSKGAIVYSSNSINFLDFRDRVPTCPLIKATWIFTDWNEKVVVINFMHLLRLCCRKERKRGRMKQTK